VVPVQRTVTAALGIVVPEATESTHRVSFTNVEFWAPAATG
jgi:hypothetical protein